MKTSYLMSDIALDIPESKVIQIIKKSDIEEQFQNISNQMNVMIYFLMGIGALICMASIYVAINMLVTENRGNISMSKVLGYGDKQINRIVLRINHILLPIGYLLIYCLNKESLSQMVKTVKFPHSIITLFLPPFFA